MKKTLIAVALMVGAGVSLAAPINVTKSSENVSASTQCSLLANDVSVGVSSSVTAGYQCNEFTGAIQVAACHAGGSRSGVICKYWDHDSNNTTADVLNSDGCTDALAVAGKASTIPNYKAFSATSNGGAMTEQELTGRCGTGTLNGLVFWAQ